MKLAMDGTPRQIAMLLGSLAQLAVGANEPTREPESQAVFEDEPRRHKLAEMLLDRGNGT